MKIEKYSDRRLIRIMTIIIVYQYELFNKEIDVNEIFEADLFNELFNYENLKINNHNSIQEVQREQLKMIGILSKNYELSRKIIHKGIRTDWTWKRMSPLVRSLLLCASVELWKLDVKIVANEYIEIAKDFIPDNETYKFINSIIQRMGNEYNEFKQKKLQSN